MLSSKQPHGMGTFAISDNLKRAITDGDDKAQLHTRSLFTRLFEGGKPKQSGWVDEFDREFDEYKLSMSELDSKQDYQAFDEALEAAEVANTQAGYTLWDLTNNSGSLKKKVGVFKKKEKEDYKTAKKDEEAARKVLRRTQKRLDFMQDLKKLSAPLRTQKYIELWRSLRNSSA